MGIFTNLTTMLNIAEKELSEDNSQNIGQQLQTTADSLFAEYGVSPAQILTRENVVTAQQLGGRFRLQSLNGRPINANQALPIGSASKDNVITINRYVADAEKMGDEAPLLQQRLDELHGEFAVKNTLWHESRHIVDNQRIGDKLYQTSAAEYLALQHEMEKSAFRESAFRQLAEYKRTGNSACITEDNKFLLNSRYVNVNTPELSEEEIRLVVTGIDEMYAKSKQGYYEKNYTQTMQLDWAPKKQPYNPSAAADIGKMLHNHTINGQKIDVSAYTQPTSVNALMTHMVNTCPQLPYTEDERAHARFPETAVSEQDIGNQPLYDLHNPVTGEIKLVHKDLAYTPNQETTPPPQNLLDRPGYTAEEQLAAYTGAIKKKKIHNAEVKMRQTDLSGFLKKHKAYQYMFRNEIDNRKKEGKLIPTRAESLHHMMKNETKNLTHELLAAYSNGQNEQLCKVLPDLPEVIATRCPAWAKSGSQETISKQEFLRLQDYVRDNLDKIAPTFKQDAQEFYDQNYGIAKPREQSAEKDFMQNMQNGHNRIAAMRQRLAQGHTQERMALYDRLHEKDGNAEKLRSLSSPSVGQMTKTSPTILRAEMLQRHWQKLGYNG